YNSWSTDGGRTWTHPIRADVLDGPSTEASLVRLSDFRSSDANRLLFANPDSSVRSNLSVRLSYDEGMTWPVLKSILAGPSSYSDLAVLPDHTIALLYERGQQGFDEKITLAHFNLDWLTNGADTVRPPSGPPQSNPPTISAGANRTITGLSSSLPVTIRS